VAQAAETVLVTLGMGGLRPAIAWPKDQSGLQNR